ncbi:hypothetical protein LQR30_13485 [Chromobacterium piscinae]|nr:hypothetical protein [Chromobacterium piscinae]MCD4505108.1 hypothetical protein [Chromobacterium piscinae]MCD5328711.1 hypothetical protein [Chromobacterium piscinae]
MSLLPKIGALLRRCQFAQSRCQQALAQLTRQDDGLQRELRALEAQGQGMRQLLQAQQLAGAVVDRGQLFALQRWRCKANSCRSSASSCSRKENDKAG